MEENSLEGKGEIMLEDEEEDKELNVDGEEGSADKESTVSSFECLGPSISVQQDVGATSTALAKKFQLDKSRQDNEDRKRKSKAMAILTLNTLYRPVSSIQYDKSMVSSSLLIKMCFSLYIILTSKLNPNCNSDGNNKRQLEPNSE